MYEHKFDQVEFLSLTAAGSWEIMQNYHKTTLIKCYFDKSLLDVKRSWQIETPGANESWIYFWFRAIISFWDKTICIDHCHPPKQPNIESQAMI